MNAINSLFGVPTRNRPTESDEAVVTAAVDELRAELRREYGDEYEENDTESRDLARVLCGSRNGYERARDMERLGWMPDARLVEILDGWWLQNACDAAVREWVESEGIRPTLTIGMAVTFRGAAGEIVAIDEKRATYTVCVPSEGHVKSCLGAHGFIVAYEDPRLETPP